MGFGRVSTVSCTQGLTQFKKKVFRQTFMMILHQQLNIQFIIPYSSLLLVLLFMGGAQFPVSTGLSLGPGLRRRQRGLGLDTGPARVTSFSRAAPHVGVVTGIGTLVTQLQHNSLDKIT